MLCEYIDNISHEIINHGKYCNIGITILVGYISKRKVLIIQSNKNFKLGTIGILEGEKITLAFEHATRKKLPVIAVVSSGGIRVNEGTLALFQMIKMSDAINQHNNKRLLYICVLDGPTLGGTSASLAALADIIVARDDAIYGFTGTRIINKTIDEPLPIDFQTAIYASNHGMIDIVVSKEAIKKLLFELIKIHIK